MSSFNTPTSSRVVVMTVALKVATSVIKSNTLYKNKMLNKLNSSSQKIIYFHHDGNLKKKGSNTYKFLET